MNNSRQDLKNYCLRALGAPVIEINVDDDQLEDRIDEAIEYWRQYHHEGVEKMYLKHKIQASTLRLQQSVAQNFVVGQKVVGQTSGATATVTVETGRESTGTTLIVRGVTGTFVAGEIISSPTVAATLASTNPVTLGEVDLRYITVPDHVYGVTRVLPFTGAATSRSMFDIQYQLRLHDLYDLTSTSIIYYKQVMGHLSLLDLELNGKPLFRFNRMMNRVQLDINWDYDINPGDYIVFDCYRALDPQEFTRVWNESWLKHYTTALFKRQWAVNLKKFSGMTLPGGVSIDGQGMYEEAMQEIKELEDSLKDKSAPLEFFLG